MVHQIPVCGVFAVGAGPVNLLNGALPPLGTDFSCSSGLGSDPNRLDHGHTGRVGWLVV